MSSPRFQHHSKKCTALFRSSSSRNSNQTAVVPPICMCEAARNQGTTDSRPITLSTYWWASSRQTSPKCLWETSSLEGQSRLRRSSPCEPSSSQSIWLPRGRTSPSSHWPLDRCWAPEKIDQNGLLKALNWRKDRSRSSPKPRTSTSLRHSTRKQWWTLSFSRGRYLKSLWK